MNAFTPVMRTHEGNRPDTNFQFYEDDDAMEQLARLVTIHTALGPYLKKAAAENARHGIPVQRPLFLHYEDDEPSYTCQTEYLLGRDILVAPVYIQGAAGREVYLPPDNWIHLWSGMTYSGGYYQIDAPLGRPPVFYRKKSEDRYGRFFADMGRS
jgi:alpha-glucosidase